MTILIPQTKAELSKISVREIQRIVRNMGQLVCLKKCPPPAFPTDCFIYCFQYPEFKGFIFGEESNKFTNNNGQEIVVEVQEDIAATFRHLVSVIEGNEKAAQLLADIIHTEINLEMNEARVLRDKLDFELPLDELAIWIDPIGKMFFFLGSFS